MRMRSGALAFLFMAAAACAGAADTAKDVPANHWARKDVEAVLQRGVMSAPGGKFNGEARVTRTDLIRTMAGFGQSLEKSAWQPATGRKFKLPIKDSTVASQGVTRYELAAVVARMGGYAAAAPKSGKRFGNSIALPQAVEIKTVKKSDPAYPAVQYLSKNRMIAPNSVLAKPGSEPVTAKDVSESLAAVVTAVVDMNTDEPQNRPDLGEPPHRDRGTPSKSGGR